MSIYTTEVRYICETAAGKTESTGATEIETIVHQVAGDIIGNYPIFDENYRNVLNEKILKHYYTREIGFETVGLWKFKLNVKMNEIMPYYNQLYKSTLLEFNPLYDTDLRRSRVGDNVEKSKGSKVEDETTNETTDLTNTTDDSRDVSSNEMNNSENESKGNKTSSNSSTTTGGNSEVNVGSRMNEKSEDKVNKFSDTPSGGLNGVVNTDYLTNVGQAINKNSEIDNNRNERTNSTNETATSGGSENNDIKERRAGINSYRGSDNGHSVVDSDGKRDITRNVTGSDNREIRNTEQYLESVCGNTGNKSFSKLLEEYRKTFLNIDMKIIDDLSGLFFGLWW